MILRILIFYTVLNLLHSTYVVRDKNNEELFIQPLPTGHVYNHFQFTTTLDAELSDNSAFQHVRLFPKALAEIISAYKIQELHLSLSHGLWRHEKWGYPLRPAPPGAELAVWFEDGVKNVDQQWKSFRNVLAGMFCASLNFMDTKSTAIPKFSFRPYGVTSAFYDRHIVSQSKNLRYSALPRETVCTENLTPWKKLLPCGDKFGLGTLLNARKLYDSHYHSLSVDFRPICRNESCLSTSLELTFSLAVVFNIVDHGNRPDWSLRDMFSHSLRSTCPLSSSSKLIVDVSQNKTLEYFFNLSPAPSSYFTKNIGHETFKYAVYDLKNHLQNNNILNVLAKYNRKIFRKKTTSPTLVVQTYQTGYGEERGGVTTVIHNNGDKDRIIVFLQIIPWYLRVYFHTLTYRTYWDSNLLGNSSRIRPLKQVFTPGKDRSKVCSIEAVLQLPPNTITKIHFELERVLLRWTEYPPDAHHGFYINSPIITSYVNSIEYPLYLRRSSNSLSETL
ncbi:DgyrCDS12063 [Dimorphilus gyrociliatus]|nr:DgyrCDS12063 [Dimorphilus gyrociliatus]